MPAIRFLAGLLIAAALAAAPAHAQSRNITLAADARLVESGLLKHLLPRFSLKHRIRVTIAAAPADALAGVADGADALLGPEVVAVALREAGQGTRLRPAFFVEDVENYVAMALTGAPDPDATGVFLDWLTSEIGQRTVAAFASPGQPAYVPGAMTVAPVVEIVPQGDIAEGEKLAHFHCGRCHVISERNRHGGIGSTPSFGALRTIDGWQDRFAAFWSLNPHPSFTQVQGVTAPFDPARPPHIAPVILTQTDVEAIAAYAATIEPKDLGPPINSR